MKMNYLLLLLTTILMVGCTNIEDATITNGETELQEVTTVNKNSEKVETVATVVDAQVSEEKTLPSIAERFPGYKLIEVDGGDLSGHREPSVIVDIGFGDRLYYAMTNEFGQLIRVVADEIILQDERTEPVTSNGRYYHDEAKVPGVERKDLDEGHVIADSLGAVSNAYNICPQNSSLNRNGDQAYFEEMIRKAGGATDFEAIITYPNNETMIPSHYRVSFTLPSGKKVEMDFDNVDPDEVNKSLGLTGSEPSTNADTKVDISSIDINGDGRVTIKEAKAAGYSLPITREHFLYPFMYDADGDGLVGE